jgi:hypothetical protein
MLVQNQRSTFAEVFFEALFVEVLLLCTVIWLTNGLAAASI